MSVHVVVSWYAPQSRTASGRPYGSVCAGHRRGPGRAKRRRKNTRRHWRALKVWGGAVHRPAAGQFGWWRAGDRLCRDGLAGGEAKQMKEILAAIAALGMSSANYEMHSTRRFKVQKAPTSYRILPNVHGGARREAPRKVKADLSEMRYSHPLRVWIRGGKYTHDL